MRLNFSLHELHCRDGAKVPYDLVDNAISLMLELQVLRDHLGCPVHVESGYRTPEYNRAVKGVPKSLHLRALAADIWVDGMPPLTLHSTIETLISAGRMSDGGLGIYDGACIHYDLRGKRSRWDWRSR